MIDRSIAFFARTPVLGKVKTRLAKDIGDEMALEVYQLLFDHTIAAVEAANAQVFAFISGEEPPSLPSNARIHQQIGADIGERMLHAFEVMFAAQGEHPMILVGTDIADISADILEHALNDLESSDVVIGESEDGGYYLIGMRRPYPELFLNRTWSHAKVFSEAVNSADQLGLKLSFAPVLNDIDLISDLRGSWLWERLEQHLDLKRNDNTTD